MNKPLLHQNHRRPITRRELLAQGFIAGSATLLAPTLFGSLLSRAARAQGMTTLPFMVFDMAGGAGLPGNFLVGKTGGPEDLLTSYDLLGWNPRIGNALDKSFGLPMAGGNVSRILQGITTTSSAEARAFTRMGSLLHFAQDDTSSNQLSAVAMIARGGYKTTILSKALGQRTNVSGGNSDIVRNGSADAAFKPLVVGKVGDVVDAVGFGQVFSTYKPEVVKAMAQGMSDLTGEHVPEIRQRTRGDRLAELSQAAYEKNATDTASGSSMDPRQQTITQQVYQINAGTQPNDVRAITATIALNAINGNAGPGVITVGGCDYHDGTQTTGDAKDLEMGQHIGRAIETAHRLKQPFFFNLITDGGVYSRRGSRNWQGDDGTKCMSVIGMYNPAGAPAMRRIQVGSYTDGQGVDRTTVIGASPAKAAYAVLANWLSAQGRLGEFERIAPAGVFSRTELESVLIFG